MSTSYPSRRNGDYMSPEDLEFAAISLLSSFEKKSGRILLPPVPLDQIIENHLGLTIQFSPMKPNELGSLSVLQKIVTINERLGDGTPQTEGRYNFTLAHEAAHEILHAPRLRQKAAMPLLFMDSQLEQTILCRTDNQKAVVEYQANTTGAAIAMPKRLVLEVWKDRFGDILQLEEESLLACLRRDADFVSEICRKRGSDDDNNLLQEHFRPMAKVFAVSPEALCIRLKTLGLLGSSNNRELFARISV